ncbi:DUF6750 family protein [Magnetospirillum sp. 15-1]|uniref:DUF6750 family protein n=1 Tax=Magnetospirillum sp. 15-1 TaxID=1979370 RepID=UPI000BBC94A1|nr:DUF6750 family protein [Magnetospirillum sp. 15-1]
MHRKQITSFALSALPVLLTAGAALAADGADWAAPVETAAKTLTTTLVTIAGAIIGLGIVGYGIWAALNQRIELQKIWIFFVCGLLVSIGPGLMMWWINQVKSAG